VQVDIVLAITSALNREGARGSYLEHPTSKYVNMLIVPEGSGIQVDLERLEDMGVSSVQYVASHKDEHGRRFFDVGELVACFQSTFVDPSLTTSILPQ
jgi:hypothetical protein